VPGRNTYTSDDIESCRDSCDSLLAAWGANDVEDTTLEALVFTQAVVVLDAWFPDRARSAGSSSVDARDEVRAVADSVTRNGGTLRVDDAVSWVPERTVLRLAVGDDVEVTANGFERLAAAYLAAIEATHPESGH
jgi:hypothetical protein